MPIVCVVFRPLLYCFFQLSRVLLQLLLAKGEQLEENALSRVLLQLLFGEGKFLPNCHGFFQMRVYELSFVPLKALLESAFVVLRFLLQLR